MQKKKTQINKTVHHCKKCWRELIRFTEHRRFRNTKIASQYRDVGSEIPVTTVHTPSNNVTPPPPLPSHTHTLVWHLKVILLAALRVLEGRNSTIWVSADWVLYIKSKCCYIVATWGIADSCQCSTILIRSCFFQKISFFPRENVSPRYIFTS